MYAYALYHFKAKKSTAFEELLCLRNYIFGEFVGFWNYLFGIYEVRVKIDLARKASMSQITLENII